MAARKGRRGAGEGAIYKDASGRWRATVDLGWKDGKRQRKYLSGKTRTEVAEKLRALRREQEDGVAVVTGVKPLTLDEWLTFWLDTIAARKVRPSTLATYRGYVRNRIVPALGAVRLDRLAPEHLEAFYHRCEKEGLAAATVLQMHRIISRALKVAHRRGRIVRNVATLVDPPSVDRDEIRPLTASDARAILDTAKGQRNAARWSVALALGLRQGEALGLPWDAVDLDAVPATLTVRQALQRRAWAHGCADPKNCTTARRCPRRTGGGLVIVRPKSRAGRRTIVIPPNLAASLRAHRAAQRAEQQAAGGEWANEHDLVFVQPNGRPLDPRADHRAWQDLLSQAGVRAARLHDARHTMASLLLAQKVHPRVVMEIMGHSQISLTLGTYSHVAPELSTDAADRMGSALWGETTPATDGEEGQNQENEKG
ncbi:site-specific recombinase XerD [Frankia casuarinae]|uniref:tyrosine-type recombinase/integrase n=1 Tax=Frankia TaxID=1854 RepID=UPI00031B9CEB|nr:MULTISPECIES: tyrosine-type recombinase/integrase [Frankia]ETA00428.1 site-specific recombinase XerD [Frankia sp. CcI6]EYT90606.1 site-specific recombinase XerD [Frankia casuarinae]KEZ34908.1 site-specific recombinase XerD [Frankia sp. CeD]KFB03022.1 site-specific recombinase XerD [Frankia sp. Allo2]OAA20053.1 site-specific recombinase XerD [Frankia casuarinae]